MRAPSKTIRLAKTLRAAMTPPEVRLWVRLRQLRAQGLVFRRQHAVGPFVLDFYCPAAHLVVEVDGFVHRTGDQPERDERRDAWLASRRMEVIRIPAADVMRDPDEVARAVFLTASARIRGDDG